MKEFFLGDTIPVDAILKSNDVPKPLGAVGLKVACAILDAKKNVIVGPVALSVLGDPNEGHVVGKIPSILTRALTKVPSQAFLEIETNDAGDILTYGQEEIRFIASPIITEP